MKQLQRLCFGNQTDIFHDLKVRGNINYIYYNNAHTSFWFKSINSGSKSKPPIATYVGKLDREIWAPENVWWKNKSYSTLITNCYICLTCASLSSVM